MVAALESIYTEDAWNGWVRIVLLPGAILDMLLTGVKDTKSMQRSLHDSITIFGAWAFWMVPVLFLIWIVTKKRNGT